MLSEQKDSHLKREIIKIVFVAAVLLAFAAIFILNPKLSAPTLFSIVATILISPLVAALERRGLSRTLSICTIFMLVGIGLTLGGVWVTGVITSEWDSFQKALPDYFQKTLDRITAVENDYKARYPFLETTHVSQSFMEWGRNTGAWFLTHGPAILGDLLTWLLIVPVLCFVILRDGRKIRKQFFELVPNPFFESTFMVSYRISESLSDYIRAKLVEAFLVASMCIAGLTLIGAPYAVVLGIFAGITNIIPYAGPFMGAAPGVLVAAFDPQSVGILWPVILVYTLVNFVDLFFIFPVIVAKLVDLHPLVLLTAVILGEQYYGLVGMLLSIPITTTLKIIIQEVYNIVYQPSQSQMDNPASEVDL